MHNKSSSNDPTEDTNLVTSLFTSALNGTFEKQQPTFIERFETTFEKSNKATGVDTFEFTFRSEGNKIQCSVSLD